MAFLKPERHLSGRFGVIWHTEWHTERHIFRGGMFGILSAMTEETRKALERQWAENEQAIQDAHALKVGPTSPIERVEALDKAQDELEADLGLDWLQRRRMELEGETE